MPQTTSSGISHKLRGTAPSIAILALTIAGALLHWSPLNSRAVNESHVAALDSARSEAEALAALVEAERGTASHRHSIDNAVRALSEEIRSNLVHISTAEPRTDDHTFLAMLLAGIGAAALVTLRRALSTAATLDRIDRALRPGVAGEDLVTRVERLAGRVDYARSQHVQLVGERIELARALSEYEIQERRLATEVRQNRECIERLEVAQMRDELTGALNFRYFLLRLNQALDDFLERGHGFCLVALDLDDFKGINDGYGHHVGDAALKEMAALLQRSVRDDDIVFRKSGDEFYVLMPYASAAQGEALGTRLLELINGHEVAYDGADEHYAVRLGTSIGILHCGQVDEHLLRSLKREQLLSETYGFADAALFKAKFSGKGCARIYTTGLTVAGVNPLEHPPDFDSLQRALRSRYPLLPRAHQDAFNRNISACLELLNPRLSNNATVPVVDCTEPVQ